MDASEEQVITIDDLRPGMVFTWGGRYTDWVVTSDRPLRIRPANSQSYQPERMGEVIKAWYRQDLVYRGGTPLVPTPTDLLEVGDRITIDDLRPGMMFTWGLAYYDYTVLKGEGPTAEVYRPMSSGQPSQVCSAAAVVGQEYRAAITYRGVDLDLPSPYCVESAQGRHLVSSPDAGPPPVLGLDRPSETEEEQQRLFELPSPPTLDDDPFEAVAAQPWYADFPIQPLKFIQTNQLEFWRGNIVKYAVRAGRKPYPGLTPEMAEVRDLQKAVHYAQVRIQELTGEEWP